MGPLQNQIYMLHIWAQFSPYSNIFEPTRPNNSAILSTPKTFSSTSVQHGMHFLNLNQYYLIDFLSVSSQRMNAFQYIPYFRVIQKTKKN